MESLCLSDANCHGPIADTVESLTVVNLPDLYSLPALPLCLVELKIMNCPTLAFLPDMYEVLARLILVNCGSLGALTELPDSLQEIKVVNCPRLVVIPTLPESLEEFLLNDCSGLGRLPELPSKLYALTIIKSSVELPPLPANLERLYLDGWTGTSLPPLPEGLVSLKLWGCPNLVLPSEVPISIRALECVNCPVSGDLPRLPNLTRLVVDKSSAHMCGKTITSLKDYLEALP